MGFRDEPCILSRLGEIYLNLIFIRDDIDDRGFDVEI